MSKGILLPSPFGYRVANSGFTGPGSGFQLRVFDTGTTDLADLFSDVDLSSATTNPLVANADGEFAATFIDDGEYDIALLDESDNVIQSIVNVRVHIPHAHLAFNFTAKPEAGAIATLEATFAFTVLENLDGSRAHAGTAPADGDKAFTIKKNGSDINTLSIAQGANDSTVGSTNAETSFAIGDTLTVVAPASQDSAMADIGVTIKVRVD